MTTPINSVPAVTVEVQSFIHATIAERSPRLYITKPTLIYVGAPSPTGWILIEPTTPIDLDDFAAATGLTR